MYSYIIKWYWDFGDGEHSTEQNPYHVYKTPGIYTVSLTVTDNRRNTATYTRESYINVSTDESFIQGLANNSDKKSFNYGIRPEQGGGWSENSGTNWVWPESPAAVLRITNGDYVYKLVWDELSGFPFVINLRPSENSSFNTVYYDKKNLPEQTDGYEIECSLKTREFNGENNYYKVKHEETYFDIRPEDVDTGYRDEQQFDVKLYTDGSETAKETLTNISNDREHLFLRKTEGNTVQLELDAATSDFCVSKIESILKVKDVARYSTDNSVTEDDYEIEFANPALWLTRGYDDGPDRSGYLYDRVAKTNIGAGAVDYTYSSGTRNIFGPDSLKYSACRITTKLELGNDSMADGTLILWHASGYTISGIDLTQLGSVVTVSDDGDPAGVFGWYCSYYHGAIPANLELDTDGDETYLYDVRLYDTAISSDALTHYYSDVEDNEGKGYLPGF